MSLSFLLFLLTLLITSNLTASQSTLPIIAIITQPNLDDTLKRPNTSIINAEYVKWVEQSAGRVLVLPHDASEEKMSDLLPYISGFLFQGGDTELIDRESSLYLQNSLKILDYAWEHSIPVFGTCLGFELLMVWGSRNPRVILDTFNAENLTMPLIFEPGAEHSTMFSPANLDARVRSILEQQSVTINLHHNGITRETFSQAGLQDKFQILSYNYDRDGKNFISTVEGVGKPFYGVQYHPERNAYILNEKWATNRSPDALISQRYFSDFFVEQARKVQRKNLPCCGDSPVDKYLIYNHKAEWLGIPDYYKEMYFFSKGF